jgi:phosphoribosylformimino-5-aminoimidazole carboxamide ribotide isomerase
MIAIPAVDLRGGACVQLVGGSFADERIRLPDPAAVARQWSALGFARLHVVDLDAAAGAGDNHDIIDAILADTTAAVQVGGGVRTSHRVGELLDAGASRVVVGTRAIEDRAWLNELSETYPDKIIVAADVRGRQVVTHGWERTHSLDVVQYVRDLSALSLGGVLVTAVHLEGLMTGTDLPLMADVVNVSPFPVIASGGVSSTADLHALGDRGVAAAVIGMALYTGALDARAVAQEFGA